VRWGGGEFRERIYNASKLSEKKCNRPFLSTAAKNSSEDGSNEDVGIIDFDGLAHLHSSKILGGMDCVRMHIDAPVL
jgi:hypothetical protein